MVTLLSVLILFRGAWASDQNLHQTSQNLSLIEFAQDHGHAHDSSLGHLHVSSDEMTDADHLLFHVLGVFENHLPLKIVAMPLLPVRDMPDLQRPPSPLPEQASSLYRPPKTRFRIEYSA